MPKRFRFSSWLSNTLSLWIWVSHSSSNLPWPLTSLWSYHKISPNINSSVWHKSTWLQKAKGDLFVSILLQNWRQYNLSPMKKGLFYANWAYIRHVYETAWGHHHLQLFKFSKYYWCYIFIYLSISLSVYLVTYIHIDPTYFYYLLLNAGYKQKSAEEVFSPPWCTDFRSYSWFTPAEMKSPSGPVLGPNCWQAQWTTNCWIH